MASAVGQSLQDLQKQANEIKESLKNVNENIKKVTGRDVVEFRTTNNRKMRQKRQNQFQQITDISNTRYTDSTKFNKVGFPGNEEPKISSSVISSSEPRLLISEECEVPRKRVNGDEKTMDRNKRMFGHLLGTLQKFQLESKLEQEKCNKRKQIEQKIDEMNQLEKVEALQKRRELFEERKEKQIKLRLLERQMAFAQEQDYLVMHYEKLKNFILLKSSPQIFYLPHIMTEKTDQLLKETQKNLEEQLVVRMKDLVSSYGSNPERGYNFEDNELGTNNLDVTVKPDENTTQTNISMNTTQVN